MLGGAAVGHWGTLDPGACGVLVLAVGKATRLLGLLPHARKQYVFELKLGAKTDSGDSKGRIIHKAAPPADVRSRLPLALQALRGRIRQTPPMHSAVKLDGQPLYVRARAGIEIPRASREVEIYDLRALADETATAGADQITARLFVECDAGTYVRVLCEDIGRELQTPAHMGMLIRVASGDFLLRDALTPERLAPNIDAALINPLVALSQPRAEVDEGSASRFVHGNEIRIPDGALGDGELLITHHGQLLGSGLACSREGATIVAPTRVLADAAQGG